ncbi:MAG: serine hydrolase [Lewinellaceae bacterium]|nr:serine hydrolase [Lewinellaceae bacterium]
MEISYSKIPFGAFLLFAFFLGSALTYWLIADDLTPSDTDRKTSQPPCDYTIARLKGYEFTRPLLSAEPDCESPIFAAFKAELAVLVDSLQSVGAITEASVYLREFDHGQGLVFNADTRYHPASLMKVALLLSTLRIAEATPGLLTKKLRYTPPAADQISTQYYNFPSIEAGKEYTVHDLLYYMAANSDNHATWMLAGRLDPGSTPKLFFDLGLPKPAEGEMAFSMTAAEISVLFKAIFNSSYLNPEYSDYAARLLSHCAFREGFGKGFPNGTKMWHKFGEWRYPGQDYELHESGVVYVQEVPYLITVMTKGKNTDRQAAGIARISRAIYKMLLEKSRKRAVGSLPRNGEEPLNP